MFKVEAVVVGAGVVGLAIARALALRRVQVLLLEKEDRAGSGTSSRSSEVIHAGLYYEPSSLKAALCVPGRRLLYRYCRERGVPHRECGKLVVATEPGEDGYLGRLLQRAEENGVEDVAHIGASRLNKLEPEVRGTSALVSGTTGIVDSHSLMLSYQADAEAAGAIIAFRTPVLRAVIAGGKIELATGGSEPAEIEADLVVNAAGLDAWDFSARVCGLDRANIPPQVLAKGNYFTVSGVRSPFRHLIYPVPEQGGLGIHLTFDLGGQVRFGPDVEWVNHIDYAVDPDRGRKFYVAIRRYWPDLPDGVLSPAYAGIRPKTAANGSSDFVIQGPEETGYKGYAALYGIESPGLTASLAIGERIARLCGLG
jgi:L-2-hydroxyglutarate oxidase LhgO